MDFKHLLDTRVDKKELVNPPNDIPIGCLIIYQLPTSFVIYGHWT